MTAPTVGVNYASVRGSVDLALEHVKMAQAHLALLGNVGLWIPDFPSPSAADHLHATHNDLLRMQNAVEAAVAHALAQGVSA